MGACLALRALPHVRGLDLITLLTGGAGAYGVLHHRAHGLPVPQSRYTFR